MAKNGLNVRHLCQTGPKARTGRILAYVAQNRILRRRLDPRTSGHLVEPEGSPARARWGPTVGAPGSPGRKKIIFSKIVPGPLGMLKQVFSAPFEPVVTRFSAWKILKCLESGPFWDQKWVQNGSKTCFSKTDRGPFGMLKQVVLAHFEPVVTRFGPWKIPKCLETGFLRTKNGSKKGRKPVFPKLILDHLRCSNKRF